jgi:arylsulfatase
MTGIVRLAFLFLVSIAAATPDFSGRWTSDSMTDMGSGWGSTITLTQDASRLTVEYAFFGRGDMQPPLRFAYALDGSETKNSVMMGRGVQVQSSRAVWQGDALVITTTQAFDDPLTGKSGTTEVKRTLMLESPASLVVETKRSGVLGGPPSTSRTVYKKVP